MVWCCSWADFHHDSQHNTTNTQSPGIVHDALMNYCACDHGTTGVAWVVFCQGFSIGVCHSCDAGLTDTPASLVRSSYCTGVRDDDRTRHVSLAWSSYYAGLYCSEVSIICYATHRGSYTEFMLGTTTTTTSSSTMASSAESNTLEARSEQLWKSA